MADILSVTLTVLFQANGAQDVKIPLYSDSFAERPKPLTAEEIKQGVLERLKVTEEGG